MTTRQYWGISLPWRHNERDGLSNNRRFDSLLNRLFRRRSKKTSKHRVTGQWPVNSPHKGPITRKMFPFDDVAMQYQEWGRRQNSPPTGARDLKRSCCRPLHASHSNSFHYRSHDKSDRFKIDTRTRLISRTGRPVIVRMIQGRLLAAGCPSKDPDRCPRLTHHHRCRRRMLTDMPQNWNHLIRYSKMSPGSASTTLIIVPANLMCFLEATTH